MSICVVCKTERKVILAKYHLGRKFAWECKCGKRMISHNSPSWYELTKAQRIALGIEDEETEE